MNAQRASLRALSAPAIALAALTYALTSMACSASPLAHVAPTQTASSPAPSASAAPTTSDDSYEPYRSLTKEYDLTGVEKLGMKIVARHPHSREAYTEGLLFFRDQLFESDGLQGRGGLRALTLGKARPERVAPNWTPDFFPEGIATDGTRIVQLSFHSHVARVWNPATLVQTGELPFQGDGWGLCFTGTVYVRSDGTNTLHLHDPATFAERGTVSVMLGGRPLKEENELECDGDTLWANVWFRPEIVRIDLRTGAVSGIVDLQPLIDEVGHHDDDDVLNGIARDPKSGHFFVTGKWWPTLFELELQPNGATPAQPGKP